MTDLADFLRARFAEDEARAQAATAGPWQWADDPEDGLDAGDESVIWASGMHTEGYVYVKPEDAEHIARWDPSRVLADCDAKRQIVEQYTKAAQFPDDDGGYEAASEDAMRLLALPYADHPDFREEWKS